MLRFAIGFLMMATSVSAQNRLSQEELNLQMCGESNFNFDSSLNKCSYCAHGLKYNQNNTCVGTPDVIGKCFGEDHYHAATQECHKCALGSAFNETSRQCEKTS